MADSLLQPSLQGDARMEALARLIARLSGLPVNVPLVNLFDLVDASALPSLGEQFHVMGVEGWNLAGTDTARRSLLKKAIDLHRHKGTPWAVEEALRATGFSGAEVREGAGICVHDAELAHNGRGTYASGNRWAVFDIEIDLGEHAGIDPASRARIRETVNAWKNARSHLRALSWRASLADETRAVDSGVRLVARPACADARPWGYPLHNGFIRYDNGICRAHDGRLHYGGDAPHIRWEPGAPSSPSGHVHDARLDHVQTAVRPALADGMRYAPLHNGAFPYDGCGRHCALNAPALDTVETRLAAVCREAVTVGEAASASLTADVRDEIGRYHDGSLSHGQRTINLHNGAFFHEGSRRRGFSGGRPDFRSVRHDSRPAHDGTACYRPWGWRPEAGEHAPAFTYQTLSDQCAASLATTPADSFSLSSALALTVLRFERHAARAVHNGNIRYAGKESAA